MSVDRQMSEQEVRVMVILQKYFHQPFWDESKPNNYAEIAVEIVRTLMTDAAARVLLGGAGVESATYHPNHSIQWCQCKDPIVKHTFGKGSECQRCGRPA